MENSFEICIFCPLKNPNDDKISQIDKYLWTIIRYVWSSPTIIHYYGKDKPSDLIKHLSEQLAFCKFLKYDYVESPRPSWKLINRKSSSSDEETIGISPRFKIHEISEKCNHCIVFSDTDDMRIPNYLVKQKMNVIFITL